MPDGRLPAEAADGLKKVRNAAQKILDSKNSSPLARKSAERNILNIDKQLGKILGFQVEKAQQLGGNNVNADGTEISTLGTILKGAGKFLTSDTGKNVLSGIAQVAPIGYNMLKAGQSTEQLDPQAFQNPLAYAALDSMNNRVPNMTPALQATDAAVAAGNANLRSTATGRGQYNSGAIAMANAGMTQRAGIYAQGSQMQNQYRGEYGQMQANLGQQMASTNLMISDLNARNQAAGRNYGAAATGQLSQWAQVQQQMAGQRRNDEMVMGRMNNFFDFMSGKLGGGGTNRTAPQAGVSNLSVPQLSPQVTPQSYNLGGAPAYNNPYPNDPGSVPLNTMWDRKGMNSLIAPTVSATADQAKWAYNRYAVNEYSRNTSLEEKTRNAKMYKPGVNEGKYLKKITKGKYIN
jgi:hypothetical protein